MPKDALIIFDNGDRSKYLSKNLQEIAKQLSNMSFNSNIKVKRVIFNFPLTIVVWEDGTKTSVKCSKDDQYDMEKGIALCFMKKALGNKSQFNDVIKKAINDHLDAEDKKECDRLKRDLINVVTELAASKGAMKDIPNLNSKRWRVFFQNDIDENTFSILVEDHKTKGMVRWKMAIPDLFESTPKDIKHHMGHLMRMLKEAGQE